MPTGEAKSTLEPISDDYTHQKMWLTYTVQPPEHPPSQDQPNIIINNISRLAHQNLHPHVNGACPPYLQLIVDPSPVTYSKKTLNGSEQRL